MSMRMATATDHAESMASATTDTRTGTSMGSATIVVELAEAGRAAWKMLVGRNDPCRSIFRHV